MAIGFVVRIATPLRRSWSPPSGCSTSRLALRAARVARCCFGDVVIVLAGAFGTIALPTKAATGPALLLEP